MAKLAWMLLVVAALETPVRAATPCGDAAAIATARAALDARCACDVPSHGVYVSCAAGEVRDLVGMQQVTRACGNAARRCAARSTCGKPGALTCCRVSRSGNPRCKISTAERCQTSGGCVGNYTSCCDACGPAGCVPTTTTTTTSSTTTTTAAPPVCGNGVIERYEECDGESFCTSNCRIHRDACCQYGTDDTACSVAVPPFILHVYQYQFCGQFGGTFMTGAVQTSTDACPNPPPNAGPTYAGACGAPPPFAAPVTVCCRHNAMDGVGTGCHDDTVADLGALARFYEFCAYSFNTPDTPATTVVGTCGSDGHCVPAH